MSEARLTGGFLPGIHPVDGYGLGGFRFAGMGHRGSILLLPDGIHAWTARSLADISAESLDPVFRLTRGLVELLLIGTGDDLVPVQVLLRQRLKQAGIVAEPMSTGAAARTYNVLLGEGRRVGAALLALS